MGGLIFVDEIKFNIGSRFLRRMVAKWIIKLIKRYFDCEIELKLDELRFAYTDGDVVVKTDVELKMGRDEMYKIFEKVNK